MKIVTAQAIAEGSERSRAAGPQSARSDRIGRRGWRMWLGVAVLAVTWLGEALALVYVSLGWSSMPAEGNASAHEPATVAVQLAGCVLLTLVGVVAFAFGLGAPRGMWRRPRWWLLLIGTAVAGAYAAPMAFLIVVFAATLAQGMLHSMLTSPYAVLTAAATVATVAGLWRIRRLCAHADSGGVDSRTDPQGATAVHTGD